MDLLSVAPSTDLLDSWKAISQYLQRDIRTLQRWESTKRLPVHRMPGGERPGVWALKSELDSWRRNRQIHVEETSPEVAKLPGAPELPSVAVLPFVNLSENKENEYFADGLADEIITALTRIPGLRVTARTSSFAFRGKDQDIRKIASSLGADAILEGTVRRSGNRVRVTAQLINAADGYHLWGECYDRELTETFAIQEDVSRAIVEALRLHLGASMRPMKQQTANPEAYQLWLQGRYQCLRHTPVELINSRRSFEEAAALDPDYPQAQIGIAESWWQCAGFGLENAREAVAIGRCAIARALQQDPDSGEAYAMLGIYTGAHDFDWHGAERHFRHALELNPASSEIHLKYAAFMLEPVGRLAEARAELETALSYDPLSPVVLAYLGQCYMFERRFDAALETLQEAAEIEPDYWLPRFLLFGTYAFQGRIEESVDIGERAIAAFGANPIVMGAAGGAYGLMGQRKRAEECLRTLETLAGTHYVSPLAAAWIHLGLGNVETCLDWLEKAVEEREPQVVHFKVKPLYDGFRAHPRFQALLRRMGLAD